ncbi:class I SAM-dependent methyltransferase, partial [Chloroflexota bacterium]
RIPGFMASAYDKAAKMVIDTYYSQMADEIASGLKSGKALDMGTGPGYLDIEIVKRAAAIGIDGIDLTTELIDIARENSLKAGVADRLHFEVMNAAELKFEDNSYDMVFSTGMLHSLKKPYIVIKVLKECYRVLKPAGEVWIYDPARVCSGIDKKVWKASLTLREKCLYWIFAFWALFDRPHYYSRAEVVQIVAATKFNAYHIEGKDEEIRIKLRKP